MRRGGEKRANKCGGKKKRETDVKRAKEWVARNRDLIFFVHIFGSLKDKGIERKRASTHLSNQNGRARSLPFKDRDVSESFRTQPCELRKGEKG